LRLNLASTHGKYNITGTNVIEAEKEVVRQGCPRNAEKETLRLTSLTGKCMTNQGFQKFNHMNAFRRGVRKLKCQDLNYKMSTHF
jgi:hypothetical protein